MIGKKVLYTNTVIHTEVTSLSCYLNLQTCQGHIHTHYFDIDNVCLCLTILILEDFSEKSFKMGAFLQHWHYLGEFLNNLKISH